jgi:hypothetical protein
MKDTKFGGREDFNPSLPPTFNQNISPPIFDALGAMSKRVESDPNINEIEDEMSPRFA